MKKIIKFSFYNSICSYLPSFGNSSHIERLLCAMTTSLAKIYGRNLTKEEAKAIVEKELEKKEQKITNSNINSLSRTVLKMISID